MSGLLKGFTGLTCREALILHVGFKDVTVLITCVITPGNYGIKFASAYM